MFCSSIVYAEDDIRRERSVIVMVSHEVLYIRIGEHCEALIFHWRYVFLSIVIAAI